MDKPQTKDTRGAGRSSGWIAGRILAPIIYVVSSGPVRVKRVSKNCGSAKIQIDQPSTIHGKLMALRDPVAVYNAATNVEAQLVRLALIEAGVEAFATEDLSNVGIWMLGLLPEIHKPQVWVERDDMARAKPVLDQYEREAEGRRQADREMLSAGGPVTGAQIDAVCEECGQSASFPASRSGTVQDCPHCGAYMDVDGVETADWESPAEGEGE